jgi:hypothetical protein
MDPNNLLSFNLLKKTPNFRNQIYFRPHPFPPDWILIGIDKYNKKIMITTIRDPDLFRIKN